MEILDEWVFKILFAFHCVIEQGMHRTCSLFETRIPSKPSRCSIEKQRNSLRGVWLAFPLRDIWSLFPIFSFSNCWDRCSAVRARFLVATSSFCFPAFPYSFHQYRVDLRKIIVWLRVLTWFQGDQKKNRLFFKIVSTSTSRFYTIHLSLNHSLKHIVRKFSNL